MIRQGYSPDPAPADATPPDNPDNKLLYYLTGFAEIRRYIRLLFTTVLYRNIN